MSSKGRVSGARKSLTTIQERLEGTRVGEALISLFVATFIVVGAVYALPDSPIKKAIAPKVAPVAIAGGMEQNWGVFAPNPPRLKQSIEVAVVMADGTYRVWSLPRGNYFTDSYGLHRWEVFTTHLGKFKDLRPGFALWVVRELTSEYEKPVRVQVVLKSETLPPPDSDEPVKTVKKALYDVQLTGRPS